MLDLNQFTGSEFIYKHWSGRLQYTDGIRYLAGEAKAYWLIDAIASYQDGKLPDDFQLWELIVQNDKAVLTCRADSNLPALVTQNIEFTDFPLQSIKLYVESGVLLLPSEH